MTMASPSGSESPAAAVRQGWGPSWADVVAGLCVAGLLLPEAVAYAGLAQMPVVHALTAALVGLALYAVVGGSRVAVVAPTSSTATLAAAAVMTLPGIAGPAGSPAQQEMYRAAVFALVLSGGVILVLLAWARQGQLSSFVSRPVLRGFAFGLAWTIVIKQLPLVVGTTLTPGSAGDPLRVLLAVATRLPDWHGPSVAVALTAALLLAALRRRPQVPAALIVIVVAMAASWGLDLQRHGVALVGEVARPNFALRWPALPLESWKRVAELAFGLVVLVFAESWGSMRSMALARGESLNPNRELAVLGACNIVSSLCQGLAVGAGFSATSANAGAGAQSRWAGGVALLAMMAALVWALPALPLLPQPVLAVAVISALWHNLSLATLRSLWHMNRDRTLLMGAVAAVLLLGVLHGMLVAVGLSLVAALRRFSQPVIHELGELGHTRNYVVLNGRADAKAAPGLLILRPEEPLFFASAERVTTEVMERVTQRGGVRHVVLSLEESSDLDSTSVECLLELDLRLTRLGADLTLARAKERVREVLTRVAPTSLGRADHLYWSVADAVEAWKVHRAHSPEPGVEIRGL